MMTQSEAFELILKACDFEYTPKKGVFELMEKVEWYKKHVDNIRAIAEEGLSSIEATYYVPAGAKLTIMRICSCEEMPDVSQGQRRSDRSVQE